MTATSELVIVRPDPLCAESPLRLDDGILTPVSQFYVRNNFPIPDPPTEMTIGGAVQQSVRLTPADVRQLPRRRLTATLECAGNGRSFMKPPVPGEQWRLGAVSTADWEGISLSEVLELARPMPDAVEILFQSADGFARSLPMDQALHRDTLLVDTMNGASLTPAHGSPLRLLVPGWYGMASVKWLAHIEAVRTPFRGHFQVERYIIGDRPLRAMQPRSLILDPADGVVLPQRNQSIRGVTWTGSGHVTEVQVSDDGGGRWLSATFADPPQPYTWRRWSCDWLPRRSGPTSLVARATDSSGNRQPLEPVWNELGYANNAAIAAHVLVEDVSTNP
jgi:sulfite oxidase